MTISHVNIKPAVFSEQNAMGWFAILEAQFSLANLRVSSTKYFHCLAALPASIVERLAPEILTRQSFEDLKAAVLALVESSKPELFESLLRSEVLVGRPSACLSLMQKTASKVGVGDEFVRHKFLNSLPSNISPVLAAQSTLSLTQLGSLADQLVSFAKTTPSCSQVSAQRSPPPHQRTSHSDFRGQSNSRSNRSRRPVICRAHTFYGPDARTCRNWCRWPDKSKVNIQPNTRPNSPAPSSTQQRHIELAPNEQGTQ